MFTQMWVFAPRFSSSHTAVQRWVGRWRWAPSHKLLWQVACAQPPAHFSWCPEFKVVPRGRFSKCCKLLYLCWIIFIPFWITSYEAAMNDISFVGRKRNGVMKCDCQGFLHVTQVWLCIGRMQEFLHEAWKCTCEDTEELMQNTSEPNFSFT